MKQKLSLILAIILIALSLSAVAGTLLWERYAQNMKQLEQERGEYPKWSVAEKQSLIEDLIKMNYLDPSENTRKLLDPSTDETEKNRLADELMMDLTKQEDVREINLEIITYAIMGASERWTPEQRVWWQQLTNAYRAPQSDPDILVLPGPDDLPQEKALRIAKEAIRKAYQLSPDALDETLPVADLYVTHERPDERRWAITFLFSRADDPNWFTKQYSAIINQKGEVIADPDIAMPHVEEMAENAKKSKESSPITDAFLRYSKKAGFAPFGTWTIEQKAAYSQELRPIVLAALEDGSLPKYENTPKANRVFLLSTIYRYGLPQKGDLRQEQALNLAKQAISQKHQVSDSFFQGQGQTFAYFDITDPEQSIWRFVFLPEHNLDTPAKDEYFYRIELRADTGETQTIDRLPWNPALMNSFKEEQALY